MKPEQTRLIAAMPVVPGVKIEQSTATIAGQKSDCLDVTGIPKDQDPNAVTAKEFHVCVSENGLLTRFKGVGTDDKAIGVELTKYSDKVDPQAFVPPKPKLLDITVVSLRSVGWVMMFIPFACSSRSSMLMLGAIKPCSSISSE